MAGKFDKHGAVTKLREFGQRLRSAEDADGVEFDRKLPKHFLREASKMLEEARKYVEQMPQAENFVFCGEKLADLSIAWELVETAVQFVEAAMIQSPNDTALNDLCLQLSELRRYFLD